MNRTEHIHKSKAVYRLNPVFLLCFLRLVGKHGNMVIFAHLLNILVHRKHDCLIACIVKAVIAAHHHVVLLFMAFLPCRIICTHAVARHLRYGIIFEDNLSAVCAHFLPLFLRQVIECMHHIPIQQIFVGKLASATAEVVFLRQLQLILPEQPDVAFIPRNDHRLFCRHRLQSRAAYANKNICHRYQLIDIRSAARHGDALSANLRVCFSRFLQ